MNLGERVTYCGFKWIFLHGSVPIQTLPNPFDGRTRFEMDTSHIFPQGVLAAITLVGGGAGDGGGQSAHSTWAGTHTSAEAVAGNPVASRAVLSLPCLQGKPAPQEWSTGFPQPSC